MFNIRNSNVFVEIGQAIGNVGGKLLRRRKSAPELVDSIFQRRLQEGLALGLSLTGKLAEPDEDVIEGTCRELAEEDDHERVGAV